MKFRRYFPPIINLQNIARGCGVHQLERLRKQYGGRNWRKLKGEANVELFDDSIRYAELHWFECHGIGKREIKIKRFLD